MPKLIPAETKAEARRLRGDGYSLAQIAEQTGMARSTVSRLVRDIPLTAEQRAVLDTSLTARQRVGHVQWSRISRRRRQGAQLMGRAFAELDDADYNAGVMLYWAEGAKTRNYAHLANADVELVKLWLGWLDRWYAIAPERMTLVINCFLGNGLSLEDIESWWLGQLELPRACLRKAIVNRPSRVSKGVRKPLLYGTAHVRVHSTFLIQSIYGAIQEIGGFDRPEWLDLGAALPENAAGADGSG